MSSSTKRKRAKRYKDADGAYLDWALKARDAGWTPPEGWKP